MVWEERWHPLREEWVIVAAHRQNRPWVGAVVEADEDPVPTYSDKCYLCPGNKRVSDARNPVYTSTYVFDNDHPCVSPDAPRDLEPPPGILIKRPAEGIARVVCYCSRHDLTLTELEVPEIESLLRVWQDQYRELGARPEVAHVLIFENKGEVVGVSNPHPHGQIYATNFVYKHIDIEARASQKHLAATGRILFEDVIAAEQQDGRRILFENDTAIAFVPYFARYAYEVYVAPKRAHPSVVELGDEELTGFAEALKRVLVQFDNLWCISFPYVMAVHQAPTDGGDYSGFHFHLEFHPPLRKPNLLKYLAGPEIGGGSFLSDTAPEDKAAELRDLPAIHYKQAAVELA